MKPSLHSFAQLILENLPQYRKWTTEALMNWINWHSSQGFIFCALDDSGDIAGLAFVRPIMYVEQGDEYYEFDPEGPIYFVDIAISKVKGALQAISFAVLKRFGQRDKIAWKRPPFFVTEIHDAKRLRHHLLGRTVA